VDVIVATSETNRTLFIGCQSGMRSQRAAEILAGAGFENVINVAGGFRRYTRSCGQRHHAGMARLGIAGRDRPAGRAVLP
jgi:predicted sulfurtransferase